MSSSTQLLLLLYSILLVAFLTSLQMITSSSSLVNAEDESGGLVNRGIRNITLIADDHAIMRVSPDNLLHPGGIEYKMMTFNGTVPGPPLKFKEGESVRITLINDGDLVHSLNLHGITGPSQALSGPLKPGENKTWILKVSSRAPSIFMYHCDGDNLNGVWEHVASGMYGSLIVSSPTYDQKHPSTKEFYIAFSEVYNMADEGLFKGTNGTVGSFDLGKFVEARPDLILTNGMAYKYIPWIGTVSRIPLNDDAEIFYVKPDEPTRWYIINAGPRKSLDFNFAAAMIDVLYPLPLLNQHVVDNSHYDNSSISANNMSDSDESAGLRYLISIPPGSGAIIEAIFPEQGFYFGNDHDLASILYGSGFVASAVDNIIS
ncbi:MAG: multicopper oxidase domain-containing protein [Nitrososphaeraceae archaeon]